MIADELSQKIQVVIPAYNEEASLPIVLKELKTLGLHRIRVVDNGSQDQTRKVAIHHGAEVIAEPRRGYGQACWTGAENLDEQIEWLLFCDGDGSDDLTSVLDWAHQLDDYDFILANRQATPEGKKELSPVQAFGSALSGTLIGLGWGRFFSDLGPMRMIRRNSYEELQMKDRGFGWTVEMQARAVENGLRVKEAPSGYRPRQAGSSKISGTIKGSFKAGTIILSTLGKLWWQKKTPSVGLPLFFMFLGTLLLLPYSNLLIPGNAPPFLLGCGFLLAGWLGSLRARKIKQTTFWIVAIGIRLLLLPAEPGDDIWRYLWEGSIQAEGFSPYVHPPSSPELEHLRSEIWSGINHKEVTAVYPPLTQLIFRLVAQLSLSVCAFKLLFIAADLLICWRLLQFLPTRKAIIYAWCPAVLYSFAAGGHYDSLFLLPLAFAAFLPSLSSPGNRFLSLQSLLIGVSVALKWVSAPLMVWVLYQSWKRGGLKLVISQCLVSSIPLLFSAFLFFTFIPEVPRWPEEFTQVARSAEFLPWLVGMGWEWSTSNNWIFLFPITIAIFAGVFRFRSYTDYAGYFFLILLICSPAFDPWYVCWPLLFFARRPNPFMMAAAVTAFLYFLLPHCYSVLGEGAPEAWHLYPLERLTLWAPFIGALLVHWSFAAKPPRLLVMLKEPVPGLVKTRLTKSIGPENACQVYRALVEQQIQHIPDHWVTAIHYAPAEAETSMKHWLSPSPHYVPQSEGDLGERLIHAGRAESRHGSPVMMIGGDCPGLSTTVLEEAEKAMQEVDLYLVPATDGGYVLIAFKTFNERLFQGIEWSSPRVLEQTLEQAREQDLTYRLAAPLTDIDDIESWKEASQSGDLNWFEPKMKQELDSLTQSTSQASQC